MLNQIRRLIAIVNKLSGINEYVGKEAEYLAEPYPMK
mgnify:FL=1